MSRLAPTKGATHDRPIKKKYLKKTKRGGLATSEGGQRNQIKTSSWGKGNKQRERGVPGNSPILQEFVSRFDSVSS